MARIIRGEGSVVPGEVVDAHAEAERIVEEAKAEAARIVEEAKTAAEGLEREAAEAGRRDASLEAAALLLEAEARRDAALADAQDTAVDVAIAAAAHIVREELSLAPERIRDIVRDVALRARRARRVQIRLHPDDVPSLGDAVPGAEVVEDPSIERGGCLIATELGQLDARLSVRLEALKKRLS